MPTRNLVPGWRDLDEARYRDLGDEELDDCIGLLGARAHDRAGSIARPELGDRVRTWRLRGGRDRASGRDGRHPNDVLINPRAAENTRQRSEGMGILASMTG